MTLPYERSRAVIQTRQFLTQLSTPYGGGMKGIRREVRQMARSLLRHYPSIFDVHAAGAAAPDVFGAPPEDQANDA